MIVQMVSEQTIDSREVANMMEKNHAHLLRDIGQYEQYLTQTKIGFSDFFISSEYKDPTGRILPCYNVTRKGCEFLAHKLTGKKGTIFTATYINRFHEMEQGKKALPTPKGTSKIAGFRLTFEDKPLEMLILNEDILFNPYDVGHCVGLAKNQVKNHLKKIPRSETVLVKNADLENRDGRKLNNAGELFLMESAVYKLAFKGAKSIAEKFSDWVAEEVFPRIQTEKEQGQQTVAESKPTELSPDLRNLLEKLIDNQIQLNRQINQLAPPPAVSDFTDLSNLLTGQRESKKERLKVEGFPAELREAVDTLLRQDTRNFSYIARLCTARGYEISSNTLGKYYRQVIAKEVQR